MARARSSTQQVISERSRRAFVGRDAERALFRNNLEHPPQDERHTFLFHVHGNAGVGKTCLVREWERIARECGALTVYVDEAVGSVPEAIAAISDRCAREGHRLKDLDRLLAAHRERRHEAETAVAAALGPQAGRTADTQGPDAAAQPSQLTLAATRAGLVGLGLLPGVGAFAGAVDPVQLAQGADRLRTSMGGRPRNQEDLRLVLAPEQVLTPVLLDELAGTAARVPWIVLFFDTYERTAPFLDGWLHDMLGTDRHGGALPDNVVVVTAGQRPLDTARWSGLADSVRDVPLGPFTETEARLLLAGRDVVAEPVVREVLRLTGRLPVLVSTLAANRPAAPDEVGDPSVTAVDRFLKWERDPVRRAVVLACALPRRLDADVFRAASGCADAEADALFAWLRELPFVGDGGNGVRYHDVVRAPMLRLERRRSPRGWTERHTRLAGTFGRWRGELEAGPDAGPPWADEEWRELRLAESYHLLCARPRAALPGVLADTVRACDQGEAVAARWARALADAGEDADAVDVARWGRDLTEALAGPGEPEGTGEAAAGGEERPDAGVVAALGLLLNRAGLGPAEQALARTARGAALRRAGAHARALAEYDRAVALDPGLARAHRGRALSRGELGDYEGAVADLDRALALAPDDGRAYAMRGEYRRILHAYDAAVRDLDRGIALDPARAFAWASRGATRLGMGELDEALADLDRALELSPEYGWALARRARVWRARGEHDRQLADLDRAVRLQPDWAWGACERGDALRVAGRHEEALADYDRALALDDAYASAYASRGACLSALGRHAEALADLDRALELRPGYAWALERREAVRDRLADDAR
ncbi:tetratricopeptide repeat protein [Streptomyces sp. NPDC005301]|uniref:tetratricopeptide repeat protein n=1 Tax=Streptomyces sp. NPDC005301 TaxID=3156874 RepID=UPI0033AD4C31